ncbi:hypothetical protein [Knoellia sp. LjRoot47]|uniref:hypothetical protein n=1 Tax=Knoellia sp. LjRoot47 TaxID=3342330 RepID=UPI003ED08599
MNRILGTAATAAVLGMSALAFASPAQAAGDNIYIVDGTYSQCLDKQRTYVSSWTKITRSCYKRDLGYGTVYAFHWTSVR